MIALTAHKRTVLGKKVKTLRNQGLTPAELYGRDAKNLHLAVNTSEVIRVYKHTGKNTVVELQIDGNGQVPVLIADLIENPLTNELLALDFRQISLTDEIRVNVPIRLIGESPAAKEGYMVIHVLSKLEVESLPASIPHIIDVNIERLEKPGDSISVESISLPKNVKAITAPDSVIVTVTERDEKSFETPATPETLIEGEQNKTEETAVDNEEKKA